MTDDMSAAMRQFAGVFGAAEDWGRDGGTNVGDYRHKYILEGNLAASKAGTLTETTYDGEKIAYERATSRRTVVRTTAPLEEILGLERRTNYSI